MSAHLRVTATRFLGPWLGGDGAVARAWEARVVSGIADRLESLRAAGLPSTVYGRILCQKNLLFGKAVFFVMNQLPSNLGGMLANWQSQFSDLLWSTTSGDHRAAAGEQRGRPPALVRLSTASQDHSDGGCRALHVACSALQKRCASRGSDGCSIRASSHGRIWSGTLAMPAANQRCNNAASTCCAVPPRCVLSHRTCHRSSVQPCLLGVAYARLS